MFAAFRRAIEYFLYSNSVVRRHYRRLAIIRMRHATPPPYPHCGNIASLLTRNVVKRSDFWGGRPVFSLVADAQRG